MSKKRSATVAGWLLVLAGLALTGLPLYSEVFTKEMESSDWESDDYSMMHSESYTQMYVPSWIPLAGGLISCAGGIVLGCGRGSMKTEDSDSG